MSRSVLACSRTLGPVVGSATSPEVITVTQERLRSLLCAFAAPKPCLVLPGAIILSVDLRDFMGLCTLPVNSLPGIPTTRGNSAYVHELPGAADTVAFLEATISLDVESGTREES